MTTAYLSQTSGYVPSHEATNKLAISYSRNVKDFAVNRYAQLSPVKKTTGLYLQITPDQAGRILSANGDEWAWADGQDAPTGPENHQDFNYQTYYTKRRAFPYTLGDKAVEEASWDVLAQYGRMTAQQAMTLRSYRCATALATAGNYTNTDTATNAGGGKFDVGTVAAPYLKKALQAGVLAIHRATLGAVKAEDLHFVIGPRLAQLISASAEVHSYIAGSVWAMAELRGDTENVNAKWNLPSKIYGTPIEVEDAVYVGTRKGATTTFSDVMGATVAALVARPGGIEAPSGGPSFSFLTQFMLEEMTVESKKDADNRLTRGRVVEDYDVIATAPAAGYLYTACSG